MIKRRKKRSRDQIYVDTSLSNEIVWTQQSGDPQVDAIDVASVLGDFTGANFHAVTTLNREFDKKGRSYQIKGGSGTGQKTT